jgi:hypothetical protein
MVKGTSCQVLALALLGAGCNLSYDNSCFTCNGTTACPSGLSCIEGYCQKAAGQCVAMSGTATTGGTTTGGTTAGTTNGTTTTGGTAASTSGGTTGSSICTNPSSGLCPPSADTSLYSCEFGCCPSSEPYACADTGLCYASADQAAADCVGTGCSTCESSWCGSPSDVQDCQNPSYYYCGNGSCCPPSTPWYCNGQGCFATQAEALAQCGNSCSFCAPPCAGSITSGLCTGTSMLTCGNACCDPSTPYYCAVNAGAGYCFVSNAEAYKYCQNSCVTCAP